MQCLIDDALIREEFPESSNATWFNTGIVGVMPKSAVEVLADAIMRFGTGMFYTHPEIDSAIRTLRERLASLISAESPTDICFTRNATEGITIGISNIDFQPGDEIVTSNQEHGALMNPLNYIHRTGRTKLKTFEVFGDPGETLQSVKDQINSKTKLMASSHVSCQTGIRLPVKEMCEIARGVGAYVLIDGAQSVGNIAVNVKDYDCDFYVGNGHKWLCGPKGTSFLYVNPNSTIEPSPTFAALGSFSDDPAKRRSALRFEYGTRDGMLLIGLLAVLDLYAKWNWQQKAGRIKELSTYLKEKLRAVPRCVIHTPEDWDRSSGNTTISMEGYSLGEVGEYLSKDWCIMTRGVPELNAVRISTNYFNTYGEIDKLIEALKALHKKQELGAKS